MSEDPLSRPVWSMLTGPQAHLSETFGGALRIDPGYGPFAAAVDRSEAALSDLGNLVRTSTNEVWLVEEDEWPAPAGTQVVRCAPLLQMVADSKGDGVPDDPDIVPLDDGALPEMAALAEATRPGPWGPKTHCYGQFFGIRIEGALAAMAGERMRPAPQIAEVSGVCTWPQYRGQGLARRLIAHVMDAQRRRGDTPFLHSYAGNEAAIGLYRSLGFAPAREMVVTVLAAA